MRFIGCDEKFDGHGFTIKVSRKDRAKSWFWNQIDHEYRQRKVQRLSSIPSHLPVCFLTPKKSIGLWLLTEADTDFVGAGGPTGYTYNVVRSEADDIIFRHAGESGAHIFDGTKVSSLDFVPSNLSPSTDPDCEIPDPGRARSAAWSRKDGTSGVVNFDYLVDASGRQGMVSTKYLKNRKPNTGSQLQSVANWAYWTNGGVCQKGTPREGCPYFEALSDASGWTWFIPLHNGTWSVGVVMNDKVLAQSKRESGLDSKGVYLQRIKETPGLAPLLADAKQITEVKSASDWSYNAPAYASPYVRIAGDAGCFIDPFFSSGVHLALTAGLSAATTICASIKGQIPEMSAATWHSKKVSESYTRFLIIVSSALKQINEKEEPVIADYDEKSFERAFKHFRPGKLYPLAAMYLAYKDFILTKTLPQ